MRVLTPYTLALWLVYAGLLLWCLRRARQMPFLVAYLAFAGVRTGVLGVVAVNASPTRYWDFYWPLQAIGYTLSAMLALSLILSVTHSPRRRIDLQVSIVLIFLLSFCTCLGGGEWKPWLTVAHWCDVAVMWGLLYSLVWQHDSWDSPLSDRALKLSMGLLVGFGGHAFCGLLQGNHDPAPWLRALYQLAGVAQLIVWAVALGTGRRHRSPIVPLQCAGAGSG